MRFLHDELVYHYTDCESCLSIIKSGSLWASDLEAVNDPAELYTARGLLHDILSVYSERTALFADAIQRAIGLEHLPPRREFPGELRSQCQRFAEAGIQYLQGYSADSRWGAALGHVFGVSFCKKPDLLSQWRAYGLNGSGICIGFDRHQLETGFQGSSEFVDVNYQRKEQTKHVVTLIRAAFGQYQAELNQLDPNGNVFARREPTVNVNEEGRLEFTIDSEEKPSRKEKEIIEKCLDTVLSELSTVAHTFKLNAFSEEQEARLISKFAVSGADLTNVQLRARGEKLIPYIEVKPAASLLPIRKVIIGPSSQSFDQTYALKILLEKKGHVDVDVERSRFALR